MQSPLLALPGAVAGDGIDARCDATDVVTANGILQAIVPDELRGRVMAAYVVVYVGFAPIGSFTGGALARMIGIQWTLADAYVANLTAHGNDVVYTPMFNNRHEILPRPAQLLRVRRAAPDAYEKVVERLLASPAYGERWARDWLDLARYADTNGYESDEPRSLWPWRDWVIEAFNNNLPFDRFTIEQLAGDLLPKPGCQQCLSFFIYPSLEVSLDRCF